MNIKKLTLLALLSCIFIPTQAQQEHWEWHGNQALNTNGSATRRIGQMQPSPRIIPNATKPETGNTLGYPLKRTEGDGFFVVLMIKCDWMGEEPSGVSNLPAHLLHRQKIYRFQGRLCPSGQKSDYIAIKCVSESEALRVTEELTNNGNNARYDGNLSDRNYEVHYTFNGQP